MKLDIILRTCDRANVHGDWRVRYCNKPKDEIVQKCVISLLNSCRNVTNHEIQVVILDDHSSEETVSFLKTIENFYSFPISFTSLEGTGYNNSNYNQYLKCRDSLADVVYAIEDDYLHSPSSIQEMLDSYEIFKSKLQKEIVIFPFDEPGEYPPNSPAFIVHGSNRHWRTGQFTTCVLMTTPKLFKDNWELFETLALKYNGNYLQPRTEHFEESNTIWNIWKSGKAIRLNPIPSLALHLQFDPQKDPFINWEHWWNEYTI
ncbi:Glycosyltransferase 2-like [uncultured Caudovirales phage]|uniref:Glycosyltransferase 2-like n=1 Tax=uncultured Caudovirales phage TaxID=2100421 RepID=A0A6J5KSX2_9CAUD|nr:Glycosyltransferase 2-like [uncultured Caudovirales phage]